MGTDGASLSGLRSPTSNMTAIGMTASKPAGSDCMIAIVSAVSGSGRACGDPLVEQRRINGDLAGVVVDTAAALKNRNTTGTLAGQSLSRRLETRVLPGVPPIPLLALVFSWKSCPSK